MEKTGLQLAIQKTEAVLLVGRRTAGNIKFTIGMEEIKPKGSVKYLGIRMNQPMTFVLHLEEVTAKAEKMVASLSRVMSMQRVSR
jgi:actin-like ATPase involved in cell morphogenesis